MDFTTSDILFAVSAMEKNLRQELIYLLVNGVLPREPGLSYLNETYRYRFQPGNSFCAWTMRPAAFTSGTAVPEDIVFEANRLAHEYLSGQCVDYETLRLGNTIYGILAVQDAGESLTLLTGLHRHLKETFQAQSYYWTMGIGRAVSTPDQLHGSLFSANHAIKFSVVEGVGKLYDGNLSRTINEGGILLMGNSEQARLRNLILKLNEQGLADYVRELFQVKEQEIRNYPVFAYMLSLQIIQSVLQTLRDNMPVDRKTFELEQMAEKQIDDQCSMELLVAFTMKSVRTLFSRFQMFSERGASKPVWIALNYIQEHYAEAITLSDVASAAGRNPQYISSIFTKECGLTIFDYIISLRIEEAKRLLRSSSMAVAEIGNAVGYHDPKYFSRTFSKSEGMSPSDYRNSFRVR